MKLRTSACCGLTVEECLEREQAEAASLREWIEENHPGASILRTVDAGREMLDRVRLAEEVGHDSVVDGLFELRDSLALALSMVVLRKQNRSMFGHLRGVLNRWGDVHLRLVRRDA